MYMCIYMRMCAHMHICEKENEHNGLPARGYMDAVSYEPFGVQSRVRKRIMTAPSTGKIHATKR